MEEFYTRKKANDGVRLPLLLPSGKVSEHWLVVLSSTSDIFNDAEVEAQRQILQLAATHGSVKDIPDGEIAKVKRELISTLIKDWSFDKPCTKENVCEFLYNAPQIYKAVDNFSANMENFVEKKPTSFADGQSQKPTSTKSKKDQKTQ